MSSKRRVINQMNTSEQKEEVIGEEKIKEFLLDFVIPEDIKTFYVNEMAIQDMQTEFILSFFEVRVPIIRKQDLKSIKESTLKPICVSRLAISVERIPDIIKVLQDRLDIFIKRRDELDKQFQEVSK